MFEFRALLLLLCYDVCVCVQIGEYGAGNQENEENVGASLGSMLKAARAQISSDAAQGRVDNLDGMTSQINDDTTALVNPAVDRVVTQANEIMAAKVAADPLCSRSWEQKCPDGWAPMGRRCLAPVSYGSWGGGCPTVFSWDTASTADKIAFAEKCAAPWPCTGACTDGHHQDYDACPQGWTEKVSGLCEVSGGQAKNDQPHCAKQYYIAGMTISQKQELASACGLQFPCRHSRECEKPDYEAACPEGWAEVGGLCVAPRLYDNSCSHGVNTTRMTHVQKAEFAAKCAVDWPCQDGAASKHELSKNEQDAMEANGPVDYATGRVLVDGRAHVPSTADHSIGRFDASMPSGAIDTHNGDIRFEVA